MSECGPENPCPVGFVCNSRNLCVAPGVVDAAAPVDVTAAVDVLTVLDSSPVDACAPDASPATLPDTTITRAPPSLTNQTTVTFAFTASVSPATFECQIDGATFVACTTPYTTTVAVDGPHTFFVRAVDAQGDRDPTPATASWTLDSIPPDTAITDGPSGTVATTDAVFSFTATEAGSTFACSLDGAPAVACASGQTYSGLAAGDHFFTVAATDPAGNVDPTPASRSWTITLPPPDTMITSAPDPMSDSTVAVFTFISIPAGATFECSLDNALPWTPCVTPIEYDGLSGDQHTFAVRAVDASGTDPTPATFVWRIDQSGLIVALGAGPTCTTTTFTFTAPAAGATFACALDDAMFAACASGVTYTGLAGGSSHVFHIHAIGVDGGVGPELSEPFVVDATPPVVTISSPMAGSTTGKTATLTFAPSAGAAVACTLDGQSLAACTSGMVLTSLAGGAHTVVVAATDACQNLGSAASTWQVDTVGPTVTILAPANGASAPASGTIIFSTQGGATGVTCSLDGSPVHCDLGGLVQYALPDGAHTFSATAVDAFGNAGSATTSFTVDSSPPIVVELEALPADNGVANVIYDLEDASDVVSVHCVIDGSDEVCGDDASDEVALTGLSPGPHQLQVYGVDEWGNSGAAAPPAPPAAERAEIAFIEILVPGRAILIGHDYDDVGSDGDNTGTTLQHLIGDAVLSSPASAFRRPLEILGYRAAGTNAQACTNVLQAIAEVTNLGGSGTCASGNFPWYSEFSDETTLAALLPLHDVLVVFDPRDADAALRLAGEWHDILETFLDRGGVVIVLDAAGDGAYQIFAQPGVSDGPLVEIDSVDSDGAVATSSAYQADDPVATASASYPTPAGVVTWETSDPFAVNVYSEDILGVHCGGAACPPDATVLEKPFPDPVVMTFYDNSGNIVTDGEVVFVDSKNGQFLVHADLGGHAVHNLRGGGSVTGAQTVSGEPVVTTFLGAERLDVLGSNVNAVRPSANPPIAGTVTVDGATRTPPADLATGPLSLDLGSSLAGTPNRDVDVRQVPEQFQIEFLDDEGLVNGFAIARDNQTNAAILYTTFAGVALTDSAATVDLPDWSDWTTPTTFGVTIDSAPPAGPPLQPIGGMPASSALIETTLNVSLSVGHEGLDYAESANGYERVISISNGQTFVAVDFPAPFPVKPHFIPTGFAQTSLVTMNQYFQQSLSASAGGENIENFQTYRQRLPVLGAGTFTAHTGDLLPMIGRAQIDATDPLRPIVTLLTSGPLDLSGGQITIESSGGNWTLVYPGGETITPPLFNATMRTALGAYITPSTFNSVFIQGRFESKSDEDYAQYRAAFPPPVFGPGDISAEPPAFDKVVVFEYSYDVNP